MASFKSNLSTLRSRGPLAEPRPATAATAATGRTAYQFAGGKEPSREDLVTAVVELGRNQLESATDSQERRARFESMRLILTGQSRQLDEANAFGAVSDTDLLESVEGLGFRAVSAGGLRSPQRHATAPTSKEGIRSTLLSRGRDSSQSLTEGVTGGVLDVTNDGKVDDADLEKIRKVLDATGLSPMDKMSRIADLVGENETSMLRLKSKLLPDDLKKLAGTPDARPLAESIATNDGRRDLAPHAPASRKGILGMLRGRR